MRPKIFASFASIMMLLSSKPVAAAPEPYQIVRALISAHNAQVDGRAALGIFPHEMIRTINSSFRKVERRKWRKRENTIAAGMFLMLGGPPGEFREIMARKQFAPDFDWLIGGAIAFAEGRVDDAIMRFGGVDAISVDDVLAGPLALTLGTILMDRDATRALQMLKIASLRAPGTIFEESALRRMTVLLDLPEAIGRIRHISDTYHRRFADSLHAFAFREALAKRILEISTRLGTRAMPAIDLLVSTFPKDAQQNIIIRVGREALFSGDIDVLDAAIRRNSSNTRTDKRSIRDWYALARIAQFVGNESALKLPVRPVNPTAYSGESKDDSSISIFALAEALKIVSQGPNIEDTKKAHQDGEKDVVTKVQRNSYLHARVEAMIRDSE